MDISARVSDPHSFDPDPVPDPAFEAGDQSGSNPDPGFNYQKLKKNYS
jgi:hypothetical protein